MFLEWYEAFSNNWVTRSIPVGKSLSMATVKRALSHTKPRILSPFSSSNSTYLSPKHILEV
jgi:hypothetical protein